MLSSFTATSTEIYSSRRLFSYDLSRGRVYMSVACPVPNKEVVSSVREYSDK